MLLKQTKIVATISDQRCEVDFIKQLFEAGMNVVRMNTAHLGREGAEKLINNVRTVSNRIAILMDTKGPEVRTTVLAEPISFKVGDRVKVVGRPEQETTRECISVSYPDFVRDLNVGGQILIDDGDLELAVIEKCDDYLLCEVQNEASLGSRKSVNVPGVRINLPSLTEKDRNNILYAIEKDIDFIAHSFVRNKQDVLDIKEILDAHGSDIRIIAKIENQEGVDNIDEILEVADGVMIARGDLGIEVPQERIPGIQRILIRKCILAKKPVIVATQMLHTMINNPRPTRAEVTDIANAIYYRTDALMLSGETAYGKYPVEAVKTMTKVAAQAEKDKLPDNDIRIPLDENSNDVTAFLAKQAVKATTKLKIRAIITDSYSGRTARNLAAFRGKYPVLAICYKEKTMRHLALSYGVEAIYMPELANGQEYYFAALRRLLQEGRLQPTDMVGYLSSGKAGTQTSFLEINVVEDALKHANERLEEQKNYNIATYKEHLIGRAEGRASGTRWAGIWCFIWIGLYIFACRPRGYMITKRRREDQMATGLKKILFGFAGGLVGAAASMKVTETVTTWSDGTKTREDDSMMVNIMRFGFIAVAVLLILWAARIVIVIATLLALLRNYDWLQLLKDPKQMINELK